MKAKLKLYRFVVILFLILISKIAYSQTIAFYDFETGLQGWTDGGSDSGLNTTAIYACNGTQSVYSKDDDTSQNYTTSPSLNLSSYSSVDFSFCFIGRGLDSGEGFSLQYYNGSSWSTLKTYTLGTDFSSNHVKYEFHITINSGLSSNSRFRFTSTADLNWEYSYFDDVLIRVSTAEIDVKGNGVTIVDGDTTPNNTDHTAFGTANLGTQITRTYTIHNKGGANLNITNIALSNTTDFSIIAPFFSSPVLASTGSTTFTVQFNSASIGTKTSTVTITNSDSDEGSYQFSIEARAEQNFFDSDGDGVLDNEDIDDDNDGIEDGTEELACKSSSTAVTANYKFLNETFGEGSRATINTTYDAITTYCYEDGTVSTSTTECPSLGNINLSDGEYVVYHKAADGDGIDDTPNNEVASWADDYWYTGEDHTPGDTNGRMAMFNASYDPGTFYTATIVGALPNVPITYSFWVLNLDTTTAPGIATRLRPNILVEFRDVNNNVLASITTGDIPPSINGDAANSWHQFTADLTFNVSEFYVYFINNEVGGAGNDLAIDDIVISQTLCDSDGDGVADVFDLDSDNDGIPDVVEAGLGNYSEGKATLTNVGTWVDSNSNGMHDLAEGNIPANSDGDATPNHLDLDSDNDTIFDVDESGSGNSADPNHQNGDGDISGDGVGEGSDTDTVRETDIDSDGTIEYFPDGILDLYDFFNGASMSTAYGNSNQGSTGAGWEYYVVDTDNDGTPDYLDVTSDGSTYDISHTLYASLDANNDGVIDDTNDSEGDGILDLFDTDDSVFGSPRDLDRKLHLYFDGRNDYAAEAAYMSGWTEVTMMAWIKLDAGSDGGEIMGQRNFRLYIDSNKRLKGFLKTSTALDIYTPDISEAIITESIWSHVALRFSSTTGTFELFLNGTSIFNYTDPSLIGVTLISSSGWNEDHDFEIGRNTFNDNNYFEGFMDEIRVFNKALSTNEIHKMVYQEIQNNAGTIRGSVIPKDITDFVDSSTITPLSWTSLFRYYRLDTYKDNVIDDLTTPTIDDGSGARIYNSKIIDYQSAPLPYQTTMSSSGSWSNSSNWLNGNLWDITTTIPECAIVHIYGDVEISKDLSSIGLILEPGSNLQVNNDSAIFNSWYIKLDGDIDLEGESQLVQTEDSTLDPTSAGTLEKDQQGTADTFTYNYWSSPVGMSNNSTNNNDFSVTDIFQNVTFLSAGYNGTSSPLSIADYWIWKFSNRLSDDYASWQHVRQSGTLKVGEGFTMKGPGSGSITDEQNYVLKGKPNNGDIDLTISAGNDYLVGNPYPSAIDAEQFILDNGATIAGPGSTTGTLYFWEHWGGGSHIANEYQGGYATYSLAGGVPAAAIGTTDPDVASGGTPTKIPGRYIPVGQGFFVTAETGGTIKFNNAQRVFQVEDGSNSLFVKSNNSKKSNKDQISKSEDSRTKIRIGFNSVNTLRRQLLVTVDENASTGVDWGYDSKYIDTQMDDMYWVINNEKYLIQALDTITEDTKIPLGIHTKTTGFNSITLDKLENVPDDLEIFLHDMELGVYHDLLQTKYETSIPAGSHLGRFEITFAKAQTLSNEEILLESNIEVFYANEKESIIIRNPEARTVKTVEMFNILGQTLFQLELNSSKKNIEYRVPKNIAGNYIINVETESGKISKKIVIK